MDRFTNEGPLVQFIHGEPKPTDGKVPENEGEEKANIENPEGAVQVEDLTRGNSTNSPVPTKDPDPHPPKKVRKEKAQLFEPIQIPLEARKFCFFHEPPQLPSIVHTLPEANGFTKEDIEALKKICNRSALFGVVTVGHPLSIWPSTSLREAFQKKGSTSCMGHQNVWARHTTTAAAFPKSNKFAFRVVVADPCLKKAKLSATNRL